MRNFTIVKLEIAETASLGPGHCDMHRNFLAQGLHSPNSPHYMHVNGGVRVRAFGMAVPERVIDRVVEHNVHQDQQRGTGVVYVFEYLGLCNKAH